jgi:hypothetical protein
VGPHRVSLRDAWTPRAGVAVANAALQGEAHHVRTPLGGGQLCALSGRPRNAPRPWCSSRGELCPLCARCAVSLRTAHELTLRLVARLHARVLSDYGHVSSTCHPSCPSPERERGRFHLRLDQYTPQHVVLLPPSADDERGELQRKHSFLLARPACVGLQRAARCSPQPCSPLRRGSASASVDSLRSRWRRAPPGRCAERATTASRGGS